MKKTKKIVKIIGIVLLIIGIGLFITGIISLTNFDINNDKQPNLFFLSFIGLPLIFAGLVLILFTSIGQMNRYVMGEVTPVMKETYRTMNPEFRDAVNILKGNEEKISCPKCSTLNDKDSVYCKNCGEKIGKKTCPNCGIESDNDSNFCKNCGEKI